MSLTISREQRDAIYELAVTHLTGIGDVWIEQCLGQSNFVFFPRGVVELRDLIWNPATCQPAFDLAVYQLKLVIDQASGNYCGAERSASVNPNADCAVQESTDQYADEPEDRLGHSFTPT